MNKILYLKIKNKGNHYECLGVYISENDDKIEMAFNAVNNKVLDTIHFNKADIEERLEIENSSLT